MSSEDSIKLEGIIQKAGRGGLFEVTVTLGEAPNITESLVLARCSGKMKKYQIKLVVGDSVDIELSPYDLTKGRITRRHQNRN